jgi:serine/threonine protein phosphatase PrpC
MPPGVEDEMNESRIYLQVAGRTDIGAVRQRNEDAFVVADLTGQSLLDARSPNGVFQLGERGVLLAVSDGIGGDRAGDVASALVAETLPREMAEARQSAPSLEKLEVAVSRTNETVVAAGEKQGYRMGATLTAIYVRGTSAWIAEVGDSRAYLVRAGTISQLTKDQSVTQRMIDAGALSPEAAARSPFRSIILQAMGHRRDISIALGRLELRALDCLVLCSDGLTTHVSDEEIRTTILGAPDLESASDALVQLANSRGGTDNITVVLGGISGTLPPPSTARDAVKETFQVVKAFG